MTAPAITEIAAGAIAHALTHGERRLPDRASLAPALRIPAATFVTLECGERLLGCVGTLQAEEALGVAVARHALGAAFDDPRVPPVTHDDFVVMAIKVSILSSPRPLPVRDHDALAQTLRPGVDGLVIEWSTGRATFLPSVWVKVPDATGFLDALWTKAGLPPRAWPPDLRVSAYRTEEIVDPGPRQTLRVAPPG